MRKLILGLMLMTGCFTSNADAEKTLKKSGFTGIVLTGTEFWACGSDDAYGVGFTATNGQGARVEGTVCCGQLFKGCTIRF